MTRNILFQTHRLLGITAGIVLAVVGATGGLLSFEHELLRLMNPGVLTVTPQGEALAPAELLERVRARYPQERIGALQLSANAHDAVRVGFVPANGGRRLDTRSVDPYTGAMLGAPRGEDFFRTVTQLHRYLVAGDSGKAIVGAATLALVFLSLSGLYLRWPGRVADWRAWFVVDTRRKGRSFLRNLHTVLGTWVLLLYLLAGLTGLYWSYDWYRDMLFAVSGAPRPMPVQGAGGTSPQAVPGERARRDTAPTTDVAGVWAAFTREVGGFRSANFRFPARPGDPVVVSYIDRDPAHDRARNQIAFDAASGAVLRHERYADKPLSAKLMSSMLALHSGSFFGIGGTVLMMLASLAMPLFAVTGWMLYLERRAAADVGAGLQAPEARIRALARGRARSRADRAQAAG